MAESGAANAGADAEVYGCANADGTRITLVEQRSAWCVCGAKTALQRLRPATPVTTMDRCRPKTAIEQRLLPSYSVVPLDKHRTLPQGANAFEVQSLARRIRAPKFSVLSPPESRNSRPRVERLCPGGQPPAACDFSGDNLRLRSTKCQGCSSFTEICQG